MAIKQYASKLAHGLTKSKWKLENAFCWMIIKYENINNTSKLTALNAYIRIEKSTPHTHTQRTRQEAREE